MAPSPRTLLKPILGLSTSAVLFGLVEGGLWLADVPPAGLYRGDPKTVWWLRPDLDTTQRLVEEDLTFSITTNALGLRGPMPPEEGAWTLALGCSTTFGWGVEAEEAWPSVFSEQTGQVVINGGTPGWSTHQAMLGAQDWLDLKPDRVILGYLLRDAERTWTPDAQSTPTPWPLRTKIGQLLASRIKPTSAPSVTTPLPDVRVSKEAYRANLTRLIEMASDAEVILLAFPHQEDRVGLWADVMAELPRPMIAPKLAPESFFANDPIHLNAAGHRLLAEQLAADLQLQSTPPPRR